MLSCKYSQFSLIISETVKTLHKPEPVIVFIQLYNFLSKLFLVLTKKNQEAVLEKRSDTHV